MKYLNNILLYFIILTFGCATEQENITTVRPKIQRIADEISERNTIEGKAVGFAGKRSIQWERYEKLRDKATDNELIILTDSKYSAVKCYAIKALVSRGTVDVFPLTLKHIKDTTLIRIYDGCESERMTVGEYFLNTSSPYMYNISSHNFTQEQINVIDSMLIFDNSIKIFQKFDLLRELKPDSKYYYKIRELSIMEKYPEAILALARYKNPNDIEIIKGLFNEENTEYFAAYSAREFPDIEFYPLLTSIFEKEWGKKNYDYKKWRILIQALAQYPTRETYKLFERIIQSKDEFRYQTLGKYVLIAITKYPNVLFEPLKEKINLSSHQKKSFKNEINFEK